MSEVSATNFQGLTTSTGVSLEGLDWRAALQLVMLDRATLMEEQLVEEIAAMQRRNDEIAQLNSWSAQMSQCLGNVGVDATSTISGAALTEYNALLTQISSTDPALYQSLTITPANRGTVEANMKVIQSEIDSRSSTQQMAMIRLQSLQDKYSESIEMCSSSVKSQNESNRGIINRM
jgi:hypothetical protein